MRRNDLLALTQTTLFCGIDVLELDALLKTAPVTTGEFHKGNLLLLAGCSYDSLWILVEGSVSAEMQDLSGKVVRVETIRAPEPLASAILFAPEPVLPVTVCAEEDVRTIALPRETVLTLCQRSRTFLSNYLRDAGARTASLSERFRLLQFATLRGRIADWLLRQSAKARSDEVILPYSKEQLAEVFAVARPSLSRELGAMAKDGILVVDGRRIRILDRVGLVKSLGAED
jgi:CRP-like cAMP-binding protein